VTDNIWLRVKGIESITGQTRGSYVLLIRLADAHTITIGNRGDIKFFPGYYAYAGSAMNGLKSRLSRHLRKDKKRHWHIDYLLDRASIIDVAVHETAARTECAIAGILDSSFESVPGFGCSDCRCRSHLFFNTDEKLLRWGIESAITAIPLNSLTGAVKI